MLQKSKSNWRASWLASAALVLSLLSAVPLGAQSGDANYPTPLLNNEVVGRIAPRDMGDARRTRHFYLFRGTEGDLVVNLEASELIGDVDVFTATTSRPLVKFTLFGDAARLTKSFYLRGEETLILRIEARAVGDAEGSYHISFGGSFAPAPAGLASAPESSAPTLSTSDARGKSTRRVTSTGARVEEPKVEPTPKAETEETAARPTLTPARPAERRSSAAARRGRGTRPAPSRPSARATTPRPESSKPETVETKTSGETSANTAPETPSANTPRATTTAPRRRGTRPPRRAAARERAESGGGEPSAAAPSTSSRAEPPATLAQRLIIVTKDGETLEQDMSAVRRVTVENNQLVVVTRDGKIIRRPMANVLKMSIEP